MNGSEFNNQKKMVLDSRTTMNDFLHFLVSYKKKVGESRSVNLFPSLIFPLKLLLDDFVPRFLYS